MKPLMLTIDFGTQSVRASLFDKEGNVVAIEKKPYEPPYFSPKVGYCEQDPKYYFDCMCECTNKLAKNHPEEIKQAIGMTITSFRDTAVLLDKEMNIVRPSVLWLDQRQAEGRKKLPLLSRMIFALVGMTDAINLNRKRTVAVWLQENQPEIWEKIYKYVPVSTYITYLLTGELKDSASNCAGHYPIDFKKRQWYKKDNHLKGQLFGIPRKLLCDLLPEGSIVGNITKKASELTGIPENLKLYLSGSDKSCETLGLGALKDDVGAISYGTASSIEVTTKKYHDSETFLPAYPSCIPNYYNLEVQVYRGYWMLNWFTKEFAQHETIEAAIQHELVLDVMNKKMLAIPPGCDGLVLQPYWGPGLRRPLSKGAIIGFSDVHTKEHLYRAIIEGIAYALREGLEHFEKVLHHKIKSLMISGGGSKSDAICQITADIFGLPVSRVQTYETSSLGAAICGFLATKEFDSPEEAIKAMVHNKDTFIPNEKNHKEYDYLFNKAYKKMFPRLKGIYKDIKEYGKKNSN